MRENLRKDHLSHIAVGLFVFFTAWWLLLLYSGTKSESSNYLFGAIYGPFMSIFGAIGGLLAAREWGGWKSVMGRAVIVLSMGLLSQAFGQIVFSFYGIFLGVEVPYPSIADLGFWGYMPLYFYGIMLLARASGVRLKIRSVVSLLQAVAIPVVMLAGSYFLFLREYTFDWSKPLTIFLDFSYPLGQALNVSLAMVMYTLSRKVLGGIMKNKILLLIIAFIAQYAADYMFLFQNSRGEYYVGGIVDYLYLVAYTLMTLGLFTLRVTALRLRSPSDDQARKG